jgi:hypothetical protein
MTRYKLAFATFFALTLIMSLHSSETGAVQKVSDHMEAQAIPLLQALAKMGEAYNCYFTIEAAWLDGEPSNLMEAYLVSLPQDKKDIRSSLNRRNQDWYTRSATQM